jgi:hypothetical protein
LTNGGPEPAAAQARRTPSRVRRNRMVCFGLGFVEPIVASSPGRDKCPAGTRRF